ncbi:MAG: helix-turn-helix transcriptional regulator [Bacteroidales bacterium]|nr:helix-turn-helix transcriptional regulator [Bacteroidales bacterium]
MIKRIKTLISVKNLSPSQFADKLGVQRSSISHILSGRNKPSLDFVLKIVEIYPKISLDWLLKGQGEMFGDLADKSLSSRHDLFEEEASTKEIATFETEIAKEILVKEERVVEQEHLVSKETDFPIETKDLNPAKSKEVNTATDPEKVLLLFKDGSFKIYQEGK